MKTTNRTAENSRTEQSNFLASVYGWMSLALIITGLVASWTASKPELFNLVIGNKIIFYGLLITQLICVGYLGTVIQKISASFATLIFLLYAALNGFTFSLFFQIFTTESIATTFFITAGTFGVMSIYGYFAKTDLTKIGNLAFMGLIGLILVSIVNVFFNNETVYNFTTYIGVLVFVALIAYDTQKLKRINVIGNEGTEENKKEAIMGALVLYLDFINLFEYFLRIFGNRKSN